jgi:HTH-type transcriptional regulator/antitoxin HipB
LKTLAQCIVERTKADPGFPSGLREAKAEVHLGVLLARAREEKGWTQQDLAERVGVPQSTVARYERATRTPTLGTLLRFCDALGIAVTVGPGYAVTVSDDVTEPLGEVANGEARSAPQRIGVHLSSKALADNVRADDH